MGITMEKVVEVASEVLERLAKEYNGKKTKADVFIMLPVVEHAYNNADWTFGVDTVVCTVENMFVVEILGIHIEVPLDAVKKVVEGRE